MFNLPPDIFNSPYLQNMRGQPQKQGWSEVNPFRTVADNRNGYSAGAYGKGLNSSASQLYDHFRQDGGWAVSAGLPKAGRTQNFNSFDQRFNPQPPPQQPPQPAVPPPQAPTSGGYQGNVPGFDFSNFNPANGIFNMQPMQQPAQVAQTRPMPGLEQPAVTPMPNMPNVMPGGTTGGQSGFEQYKATGQLPNVGGIFNMPQFSRR